MSEPKEITDVLQRIERASKSPRELAKDAVGRHRKRREIVVTTDYDFGYAPREMKEIVYNAAVRFSRRRWWSRLLR